MPKKHMFAAVFWAAVGLVAMASDGVAQDARQQQEKLRKPLAEATATMRFDLSPQSLPDALAAYDQATGFTGLYAADAVAGLRSGEVRGVHTPAQALRLLLAPTRLNGYFTATDAYVLEANGVVPIPDLAGDVVQNMPPAPSADGDFPRLLQAGVRKALCSDRTLAQGGFRAALRLEIAVSGRVERVHLLDTTGSKARDADILRRLGGVTLPRGPVDPGQSFVMLILPHTGNGRSDCEGVQ